MTTDLFLTLPLIIVSVGSLFVLMIDVFAKGKWPSSTASSFVLLGALLASVFVADEYRSQETAFSGLLFVDPFTIFVSALIIAGAIFCLWMGRDYLEIDGVKGAHGEYLSLYLMATAGALLFVASAELITLFLGLELMSMALYALCGSALWRSGSAESAMKYFFLGSFSSAFLLLGIAFLYGATGTMSLLEIASVLPEVPTGLISIGIGLILLGVLFKIGAVPLHFWTPDVYQGAPTPVTMYMASVIKIAAVCVGLRIFWLSFGGTEYYELWSRAIWISAVLTIIVGNVVAIRQRSVKRMLAYSSVAHAGYMLMGFLAPGEYGGGPAILFYLVAYSAMTLGAFGIVMAVASRYQDSPDSDDIFRFNNLSKRRPYLAALMSLFLLSLAGLPPGMAGLLGKFYVFNAAVKADFVGLAIIGVIGSAMSCYYYLRVIVAMYFVPGQEGEDGGSGEAVVAVPLGVTLAGCAVLTVLIGVQPSYLYNLVEPLF
ncbi:MAG: NADH-quinone oxidoreductase subunit N [Bdellovibrionales bacterium]|nr:NADH-quinone oxidoreductase subunit N [Bdellovibrionales bacterium]